MNKQREALETARSFLLKSNCFYPASLRLQIEAALAEPEQEPIPGLEKDPSNFVRWAEKAGYDMSCHPLHFLFLDAKTNAARMGWKAAVEQYSLPTPKPREWQEMSETELHNLVSSIYLDYAVEEALKYIRNVYPAISAALRAKNEVKYDKE